MIQCFEKRRFFSMVKERLFGYLEFYLAKIEVLRIIKSKSINFGINFHTLGDVSGISKGVFYKRNCFFWNYTDEKLFFSSQNSRLFKKSPKNKVMKSDNGSLKNCPIFIDSRQSLIDFQSQMQNYQLANIPISLNQENIIMGFENQRDLVLFLRLKCKTKSSFFDSFVSSLNSAHNFNEFQFI